MQHVGELAEGAHVRLEHRDGRGIGARQGLQHDAASRPHRGDGSGTEGDAQEDRRRHLLGLHQERGDVLGDLARHEAHGRHVLVPVRRLRADDLDVAGAADGAADVELAVGPEGQVGVGGLRVPSDGAVEPGVGDHAAERAAAVELERDAITVVLEQDVREQDGPGERPPERGAGRGAGAVTIEGVLDELRRVGGDHADGPARGDAP
jgi:hypothetical protein